MGGDGERLTEYEAAAEIARDRCFIGGTIKGSVAYVVGEVSVSQAAGG